MTGHYRQYTQPRQMTRMLSMLHPENGRRNIECTRPTPSMSAPFLHSVRRLKKLHKYLAIWLCKGISHFIYKHPAILFATQRYALLAVSRHLDIHVAFRMLKRPEWVLV